MRKNLLALLVLVVPIPAVMAQSVSIRMGSGSGLAGSIVSVPISISSAGGAQPTAVQWSFGLPAGITVASVEAGDSAISSGKSLSCNGVNCLVFGLNTTPIPNGTIAVANLQVASNASGTLTVNITGVVASDVNSIPASGSGGTITVTTPVPTAALGALSCGSGTIQTPGGVGCTVTLTAAAPSGGFAVGLSSNNSSLTVPASVSVASGQSSAGFTATAANVAADTSAIVTASAAAVSRSATISLLAPASLSSISCSPASLNSGQSSSCTVSLTKATASALSVSISSNSTSLPAPASVTVNGGASGASFSVVAGSIASNQTATITASLGGVTRSAQVGLIAPAPSVLSSLACTPNTFNAPGNSTCIVSLTAAAAANAVVTIADSSANVTTPSSVTVLAGQSSAQFVAAITSIPADELVTASASLNGATKSATLTLTAAATLYSITCAPGSLNSGQSATCAVSLSKASVDGASVLLSVDNPALSVPASANIASGAASTTFAVTAGSITSGQTATVTASLNGVTRSIAISLAAPLPSSLNSVSCSPNSFSAAGSSTCTVTLTAQAAANALISISDNSVNVTTPGAVTVLAGQSSAQFGATITGVVTDESVSVTASLNGGTRSSLISLSPVAALSSLSCSPATLGSGQSASCTVSLTKASASGVSILLSDDNAVLATPGSVSLGAGASTGSFAVTAGTVATNQLATITASLNGVTRAAQVSLEAPAASVLTSLSCSPSSFSAAGSATCTAGLSAPAAANAGIRLSSSNSNVSVPASATVLAGQSSVQFTVSVAAVSVNETVTITANLNGVAQTVSFTLSAPALPTLTSLTCAPSSLAGNQSATCTVSLNKPAVSSINVALVSDHTQLTTPASVIVGVGSTSSSFDVSVGAIWSSQTANITASLNGLARSAQVNLIAPTGLSGLSCSPSTFSASGVSNCTVTLVAAASSNTLVTLSVSSANLAAPSSVTVLAGQSSTQFSVTVGAVQSDEIATVTASLNGGIQTAMLTLVGPGVLSSLACSPSSLQSNESATCTVVLSKASPAGAVVTLAVDNASLTTPATVAVTSGASSGSFKVTAGTIAADQVANITANLNGSSRTAQVALSGNTSPTPSLGLTSLVCAPSTVNPGGSSLCVITLSVPATAPAPVGLLSDDDTIALAASVTVPTGSDTAQFRVNIPGNALLKPIVLTARLGTATKSATLNVVAPPPGANPTQLLSLACAPSQLDPGESGVCTVYLKDIAEVGVALTVGTASSGLIAPASVQIPAGAKFQSFTVVASTSLLTAQDVDVTAALNGTSVTTRVRLALGVSEPSLTSFDCSLTSLTPGGGTACVVNLKSAAPFAAELSLSSSNSIVQLPSRLTVVAGTTSVSFSIQAGATDTPLDVTISAGWHGRTPLTKSVQVRPYSITLDVPSVTFARVGSTVAFDVNVTHSGGLPTETFALGSPTGVSLRGTRFSWIPSISQIGEHSITFRAIDANGSFGTGSARLAIRPEKPTIAGLYNPAGFNLIDSCSPNAIVTFLGSGFSLHDPMEAGPGDWPTELAGVRIRINGVYAPLTFVSDTTVHFQCPASNPGTSLEIVMEYEVGRSSLPSGAAATGTVTVAPFVVRMSEATPGVYIIEGTQGAALIAGSGIVAGPPQYSLGSGGYPARAAVPGEYLEIYANGLGSTSQSLASGKPAPLDRLITVVGKVTAVFADEVRAPAAFAGLSPGSVGLFQANIQVPAGTRLGAAVPFYLELMREDGTVLKSNTVTVAIAATR